MLHIYKQSMFNIFLFSYGIYLVCFCVEFAGAVNFTVYLWHHDSRKDYAFLKKVYFVDLFPDTQTHNKHF